MKSAYVLLKKVGETVGVETYTPMRRNEAEDLIEKRRRQMPANKYAIGELLVPDDEEFS